MNSVKEHKSQHSQLRSNIQLEVLEVYRRRAYIQFLSYFVVLVILAIFCYLVNFSIIKTLMLEGRKFNAGVCVVFLVSILLMRSF